MSATQEEIIELNSISSSKSTSRQRKHIRRNQVSSPIEQSPKLINNEKVVPNLFTVNKNQTNNQLAPIAKHRQKKKSKQRSISESVGSSDFSDDVFTHGKSSTSSSTPTSSNKSTKSYRDKINERFKSIKAKVGQSSNKADMCKRTTRKIILDRLRKANTDIDTELQYVRDKYQLTSAVESQSAYNFFCAEELLEPAEDDKGNLEDFQEPAGITDSTANLTEQRRSQLVGFSMPETFKFSVELSEAELFFTPNGKPVNIADKIEEHDIRHLEDEGLYVRKKPQLPLHHINLLEQRLLAQNDRKFFNCEGNLDIAENPFTQISIRPHLKKVCSSQTTCYRQPTVNNQEDCEEIVIEQEKTLHLQIVALKFTHHPLFSVEHVLEQKLIYYYELYRRSTENNNMARIRNKLEAFRLLKQRTENLGNEEAGDGGDSNEKKIDNYREEIKILQETLFNEGKKERRNLKLILETWKSIKKLRKTNNYSNTSIRLIITKTKVDYAEENEIYQENFNELFKELISEQRRLYKEKLKQYKRKIQENGENTSDDDDDHERPKFIVDEKKIKDDLSKQFEDSFRSPGEPILSFSLTHDNEITKTIESAKENLRRNAVKSTKVTLKIMCNKLEVCKSQSLPLNDQFICNLDQSFSIQLIHIPKFLTIEIIEQSGTLLKRKVDELVISLPPKYCTDNRDKISVQTFVASQIIHYNKHEGVGSGFKLESILKETGINLHVDNNQQEDELITTSGQLNFWISWAGARNRETDNKRNCNFHDIIDNIVDKNGKINLHELKEWLSACTPDPQDPRHSILYEYSSDYDQDMVVLSQNNNKYFRLNPYMKTMEFCAFNEIEENIRLKILQLRDQNEPEFDGMIVPNRLKEINFNALADYKRRIASAAAQNGCNFDEEFDEEIRSKRSYGEKYLKQIYIKIFQQCKNSNNNLCYEDVVDEKFLLYFEQMIKQFVGSVISWFRWRPLRALHHQSDSHNTTDKMMKSQNFAESTISTRIIINLNNAINIPSRIKESNSNHDIAQMNENEAEPFIEISYNKVLVRSSTGKGTNPIWNEELVLPVESLHTDYLNPNSFNGSLTINLFDETDSFKIWLGYLEIPISVICYGTILKGKFKLKLPQLLLGQPTNHDESIYLDLVLQIEPNLPKLTPNIDELPSSELPYIKEHVLTWNENFNANFPSRKFSALAIGTNGKTICITRYIKPLEPPQLDNKSGISGLDVTSEQILQFVSLIPFTDCNQFYQNIWLTTDELLNLRTGSTIDHAIALTCYLLALNLNVSLLLGFGIPHGSTAYVLIQEYSRDNEIPLYSVYDVIYGEKYEVTDPFCTLQRIFCVINETNIWANTQRNNDVALTRFDFNKKFDWLPVFNNEIIAPTNSINNKHGPEMNIEELESQFERKIRKKLANIRRRNASKRTIILNK